MSEGQIAIRADLRYPNTHRNGDRWSQWSSLPMMELSALETYQFVNAQLHDRAQRILEIGCGNGYLSLELAREGHEVVGLDRTEEIIEAAQQTRAAHPDSPGFGKLLYLCADFSTWQAREASFDLVIINRTLHHLPDLERTLAKVNHLLTPTGRLICQDYAYDRLNEQTARWIYMMQRMLFLSGLSDEDSATQEDEAQSIQVMRQAWLKRSLDHGLHGYEAMRTALQLFFQEQLFAWVPYLFVFIGNGTHQIPWQQERKLIAFLKNIEQHLIDQRDIQAVGFRYVGRAQLRSL